MKTPLFALLLVPFFSYAQHKVTGKIADDSGTPVDYAEVILQSIDSSTEKHELTTPEGSFSVTNVATGSYELFVKYFGESIYSQKLAVDGDIDLGLISTQAKIELDDVVFTGTKPLIERKADRLVFNVENSPSSSGGDALDALKITPRVKVDDDKISMIGKDELAVMVNGRRIELAGEDLVNYLKSISSDNIKSVEVIANPPAKYSAEGNSGLLNIILKKPQDDAWNASLKSTFKQASYTSGSVGGTYNLQKGKLQLLSSVDYFNGVNKQNIQSTIDYPNLGWEGEEVFKSPGDWFSVNLGLEYKISDHLTTGASYKLSTYDFPLENSSRTELSNPLTNHLDSLILSSGRRVSNNQNDIVNFHFIYTIDTAGRKLSTDFDYFHRDNESGQTFSSQKTLPDEQPIPNTLEEARNIGEQNVNNYAVTVDMEHPTSWANLNYGAKASFTETDNYYDYFDISNGMETFNPQLSNKFNYEENTQAIYLSAQRSFSDKWEAKVGLRYEITQTEGFSETLNQTDKNNYSELFPTAYVTYNPNEKHTLGINYGKRINRPYYSQLNPFRLVLNPFLYVEGNPFLQPAFTKNLEIEHSYKSNLITSIYYTRYTDGFNQVSIIDQTTNIQQFIPLNFISSNKYGFSQTLILKPTSFWDFRGSADVDFSESESDIAITQESLSGWSGAFTISNDFQLNKDKTLSAGIYYNYYTSGVSHFFEFDNYYRLDASIKWILLDEKLTLSLHANDILKSRIYKNSTLSNGIKTSFRSYNDSRYVRISASYNFGKKFQASNRQSKNLEEQSR